MVTYSCTGPVKDSVSGVREKGSQEQIPGEPESLYQRQTRTSTGKTTCMSSSIFWMKLLLILCLAESQAFPIVLSSLVITVYAISELLV